MNKNMGICSRKARPSKVMVSSIKSSQIIFSGRVDQHYQLGKLLGSGSFGVVRKAKFLSNPSQTVAIKSIDKRKLKEDAITEVNIIRQIDHPNIIKYYDCFEDKKYIHIVMEYCSGGELFEKIVENSVISEKTAAKYLEKILLAINHLHTLGICHRDLKPQNFLFENKTPQAELKLIDFGLSKSSGTINLMNSLVGTSYYLAPEVIKGSYGLPSDLWAIGVMMYMMISGSLPFGGQTDVQIFKNIRNGKLDTNNKKWKGISPSAKDLIRKLLNSNPRSRINAKMALNHPWIKSKSSEKSISIDPLMLERLTKFKSNSKMKGYALGIMVKHLEIKQIKELREAFYTLDVSHTGYLSLEEVKNGFAAHLPSHEADKLFSNLDLAGNGQVNYSEFLAAAMAYRLENDEQLMCLAFQAFDVDSTGYITSENLDIAFKNLGITKSLNQIEEIIKEVDFYNGFIRITKTAIRNCSIFE